ncbi:MAG: tRNA1(Val) (adenine(37)-N6)-methyltransferase [Clostridia bacterium]|nr:tRNA1(Val) (adenine(37)-N6)-methyltransferase [Clostridia bacterium]
MERIDEIGFGGLKLIQDPERFCYGVDAVLLADFAAKQGKSFDSILDLGTGTGIIPFILSYKTDAKKIVGVEILEDSYEMAQRGAKLNGLEDRVSFLNMNVKDVTGTFDAVTCNPPYQAGGTGVKSDNLEKMAARHEIYGSLEDFIGAAARTLKDKGDFFMVHRPARIVDISTLCRKYNLEPKEIRFVSPREGEVPNILLIHCVKNGGKNLKILKPLNVYEGESYTKEILEMY